jgi:hypothetical protein
LYRGILFSSARAWRGLGRDVIAEDLAKAAPGMITRREAGLTTGRLCAPALAWRHTRFRQGLSLGIRAANSTNDGQIRSGDFVRTRIGGLKLAGHTGIVA